MTITLATLKDATAQQVFDQVAAHLLKQNARSTNAEGNKCMYRGADGMMCAAGCLIADDEYKPEMDVGAIVGGGSWASMVGKGTVPADHKIMIMKLQRLHDSSFLSSFSDQLRKLAEQEGLVFNHAG